MGARIIPFNEFIERFKRRSKGEYEYISGYTRMTNKIKVKHLQCGNEFEVVASAFINTKTKCKKCTDKVRAKKVIDNNIDIQKQYVYEVTKGEYELIEYNGLDNKALFLHKKCNNSYSTRFEFFKRGNRCPHCQNQSFKYDINSFNKKYYIDKIKVLKITYPGPKIDIMCEKCGTFKTVTTSFFKKTYNFNCCKKHEKQLNKNRRKLEKEYKEKKTKYEKQLKLQTKFYKYKKELDDIHNNNILIKEIVYDTQTKFKVECKQCGHLWENNFHRLRQGKGCPVCKASKGEKTINKYLLDNNYNFKREYRFEDSEISSLRFDFAVFLNNEKYLIEFDGKQHFSEKEQFGEKINLKNLIKF